MTETAPNVAELRLPSLPPPSISSALLSWQPKPATAVWTQAEWAVLFWLLGGQAEGGEQGRVGLPGQRPDK